ncbi:DUF2141 domain-containing protein [Elstera litoralis]|nr:DUF2141 domain-containing protein [Elstera litoralis]
MPQSQQRRRAHGRILVLLTAGMLLSTPAWAGEIVARITAPGAVTGEIGCSLFSKPETFPLKPDQAVTLWLPAAPETACRFTNIAPGRYALAVSHDRNGNRRLDENFFGIPTEAWGVSGNIRPSLRAPRFDEAAFSVAADGTTEIAIEVLE